MDILKEFYFSKHRDEVKAFLKRHLDKSVLNRTYAGLDTTGLKLTNDIIESAFKELQDTYEEKDNKPKIHNRR